MATNANCIVTVNAGSSSIKVVVFSRDDATMQLSQLVAVFLNDIGQPMPMLHVVRPGLPVQSYEAHALDHVAGAQIVIDKLAGFIAMDTISAIGHRLVHGGMKYSKPTFVSDISESDWQLLAQLDPEHTPAARHLIRQFTQDVPTALHVACFDTAFFRDLPSISTIVPIPKKYSQLGVRRYGFHGLSYTSLLDAFRQKAGDVAANGRVVLAHLGSGASLAATRSGKPVDTTMGLTPTSGVAMSTRSGDLDPNLYGFLYRQTGMDIEAFNHMVSFESGLLGVSGSSGDMRTLLAIEHENEDAKTAIDLFIHDIKKAIGSLSATLGGIDSLIFSGGIGEQSAEIRARICQGLEYLGIEINEAINERHEFLISAESSKVGVHVIPTDEAKVIAAQTNELVQTLGKD